MVKSLCLFGFGYFVGLLLLEFGRARIAMPELESAAQTTLEGAGPGPDARKALASPLPLLKVYVGYDPRLHLPYEVTKYSLTRRASIRVEVIRLEQSELRKVGLYSRKRNPMDITEFTLTRFLTPYLAGFSGWAMFVDSDFLYSGDVRQLVESLDDRYAAVCVKHDYTGRETTVMDGQVRPTYKRMNWSSMVLYNCSHPKNQRLTPEFVNTQPSEYLQKLMWLEDEDIGGVPRTWNFLVGRCQLSEEEKEEEEETTLPKIPKAIHFTEGGPWYERWKDCQFSDLWFRERDDFQRSLLPIQELRTDRVKVMENDRLQGLVIESH